MNIKNDWKWLLPIALACLLVFANSLSGDFVYDDLRQIVRNPLIQDNAQISNALTSDVWAFKGDGTITASNYWRPTFTAWHILNFRLFGAEPFGWHVTNVLLHLFVSLFIFVLLRRWNFSPAASFAAALIFAVHPVHVESVAWISGSPDLLFSAAFLGSLWFAQSYLQERTSKYLYLTVFLYFIALGAKEIGILCLPIYYFLNENDLPTDEKNSDPKRNMLYLLGFAAVVYFVARFAVLGFISSPPPEVVTFTEAILSLPGMFVFYIKQVFFPIWMSANYPFQPVSQIGFSNFVMPLITAVIALGVLFYAAKSLPKGKLAASIFLLPLLPAMNALAFMPDQIVHDRYLYLPLLGILMLGVAAASKYLSSTNLISAAVVISLICGYITLSYNFAWQNEIALWQWSRTVDDSSFTARQLGSAYAEAERNPDAIKAFTDSINKKSTAYALLGRGRAAARTNDFQTAERDLKAIIDMPDEALDVYTLYQAYEGLGLVYTGSNRPADAERNFIKARERLPIYSAALTTNLAIVLYQKGDKARALQELEAVRGKARVEMLPESKAALLRLGMLYAEMGKRSEASVALNEYLTLTAALKDKNSVADRTLAMQQLQALR